MYPMHLTAVADDVPLGNFNVIEHPVFGFP
jgi:hypothetical protein